MAEENIFAQNKKKAPEAKESKPAASGEQSVLGGNSKPNPNRKPITFYKKAWFWIIIAVVVLGIAGLIVFLVINSNMTAEAIEKYTENGQAAVSAANKFESSFRTIYSDAGMSYYSSSEKRTNELHDKCLKDTFGIDKDVYESVKNIEYHTGEAAAEALGTGKTRELSDNFKKIADSLENLNDKISGCKEMLNNTVKGEYDVEIGEFEVEESGSRFYTYYNYKLPVKITNKSSEYKIKFAVYFKAVDADGKQIATDYFYSDLLEPGETGEEKVFNSGYTSKLDDLKTAKFEITEVKEVTVE